MKNVKVSGIKKQNITADLRSAFEAMNITSLDEILNTSIEPLKNPGRDVKIRMFLYQLCQNDTPEWFIIEHLIQGFTLEEIGKLLGISKQGVEYHLNKLQTRVKENGLCISDVI